MYPYSKTSTETFLAEGTMSFGNNSKLMVQLEQILHGEETQYQLRQEMQSDHQGNMHHKTKCKQIQTQLRL